MTVDLCRIWLVKSKNQIYYNKEQRKTLLVADIASKNTAGKNTRGS